MRSEKIGFKFYFLWKNMKKWFCFCFQRDLTIIEKRDFIVEYLDDVVILVITTRSTIYKM